MTSSSDPDHGPIWLRYVPSVHWLAGYRIGWLAGDIVAGITLAAYAIPVSLAYAALAGLPPQVGIYGYLLGGLGYALLGSSRHLAVGPTSAISLMVAGTVGAMAEGDAQRYAQIATLAGFTVAILCLITWLLRLSILVRLVSDSILVGFKAGAGLTIIMTQLPSLFGIAGGGRNFLALSLVAALTFGLPARGVPTTGKIPAGLPSLEGPALRLRDVEGIVPLAAGCLLLAYIEGVSAARTFAGKHGYNLDLRQEFLGLGAANLAAAFGHGYPVAGGRLRASDPSKVRLVVCDLSASPHVDLAGSRMLHQLHDEVTRLDIKLRIVAARGRVRDLLRSDGIGEKLGGLDELVTLYSLVGSPRLPG